VGSFPVETRGVLDCVLASANQWDIAPRFSHRAMRALRQGATNGDRLLGLAEADVIAAARLIQTANAPFFGMAGQIGEIRQAIGLLGPGAAGRVIEVLAMKTVERHASCPLRIEGRHDFGRFSLATACAARRIARSVSPTNAERAYLCGFVHEIGAALLHRAFGTEYEKIVADCPPHQALSDHEQVCIGTDHAEVGYSVLTAWGFPAAGAEDSVLLARIVGSAVYVARLLCGQRDGQTAQETHAIASRTLSLGVNALKRILAESATDVSARLGWLDTGEGHTSESPSGTLPGRPRVPGAAS
jgi:hypothetical protein